VARRDGKSADAFRTISEVAEDVDVPQHVLRFWETKFPQIKPLKRGGGRRYYRPEDVDLIRRVRNWLYDDGYTIKGVQKLLREGAGSDDAESQKGADEAPAPEPAARETEDKVSADAVLHALETGAEGALDDAARAAIGAAISELEQIRDRLRAPDE
jgi:DNA-binding transcriptional MerR regulator